MIWEMGIGKQEKKDRSSLKASSSRDIHLSSGLIRMTRSDVPGSCDFGSYANSWVEMGVGI